MIPITPFNPAQVPGGVIAPNGVNNNQQLLLYNSSLSCLQITFGDKTQDVLPPAWARSWVKSGPMARISYVTNFTLPLVGQPVSTVYGTIYEQGEHIQEVNGPLQYVYNVGNTVNTVGGASQNVQDDGRAAGNFSLEATPSGDGVSAAFIKNNGLAQLGSTAENGQLDITNILGNHSFITGDGIGTPSSPHLFFDTRTNQTFVGGFTAAGGVALGGNGTVYLIINNNGLQITPPSVVLNGGGGGTATLYMDCTGTIKRGIIVLNAFKTGASNQTITFPVAFTTGLRLITGNIGSSVSSSGMHLNSGGSSQLRNVVTALSDTGGTVTSTTNPFYGNSIVFCDHAIDAFQFDSGWTSTHSGTIEFAGI